MPPSAYITVTIIACLFLLLAGLYRPVRVRMTRTAVKPFKPFTLYPYFLAGLGLLLASPALLHLQTLLNPGPGFTVGYMLAGALTGLLGGGLYVLGYEGQAPYKPEALLILPLLGAMICLTFAYMANL